LSSLLHRFSRRVLNSFHAQYRDLAAEAVADADPKPGPLASEEDLAELPRLVLSPGRT
jgi:hypothetical protein